MARFICEALSRIRCVLQQVVFEFSSRIENTVSAISLQDEATEPQRAFYLFSLLLLISFIFLAPDKIGQVFTLTQADISLLEKVQDAVRVVKRLLPTV